MDDIQVNLDTAREMGFETILQEQVENIEALDCLLVSKDVWFSGIKHKS